MLFASEYRDLDRRAAQGAVGARTDSAVHEITESPAYIEQLVITRACKASWRLAIQITTA